MNSIFHEDILEYLSRRERVLARVSSWFDQCVLLSFDQHLANRNLNKRSITGDDVISWIKPLNSKYSRSTVARWVSALRVFLQYLEYVGIQVYIPPYPKVPENYIPYLFSDTEIEKILAAADAVQIQQKLKCPFLRMEFPMLLRMLYSCGFRLGELLTVRIKDVSFERGTVLLRNTKNKKQRIVPMTDTLTEMLNRYCLAMNLMSSPDNFIFPGQTANHHLSPSTAEKWFQKLLISTGIYVPPDKHSRGQCLHCFRHLFAVKSFAQAEQTGRPVNDSLPFLSVYLGHTNMMKTEKYLKFSSDMFPEHTVYLKHILMEYSRRYGMKSKEPEVMELLNIFIEEYMPHTAGLSENTIRLYKATFRLLLSFLYSANGIVPDRVTFHTLDYPTVTAFLNWLESERHCSIATRNVRLAALSSFAAFAQNHNFDAALIFMTAIKRIPSKKTAVPPRIFFSRDEVSALLRIPDLTTDTGRRDAALLSLMYASGARAQEICDLKVRDILFEGESTKLILTGKGKKTRRIVIAKSSATTLKRYIAWRQIEQKPDCYVFSSQTHEHMTISCVEAIYKKYLQKLKKLYPTMFQEKRYSPHAMRHTCAMHMLEAGVPLMAIKNFLGHVSVTTTERYAEFAQSTVDKHIKDWNQRWFKDTATSATSNSEPSSRQSLIPDFLR